MLYVPEVNKTEQKRSFGEKLRRQEDIIRTNKRVETKGTNGKVGIQTSNCRPLQHDASGSEKFLRKEHMCSYPNDSYMYMCTYVYAVYFVFGLYRRR